MMYNGYQSVNDCIGHDNTCKQQLAYTLYSSRSYSVAVQQVRTTAAAAGVDDRDEADASKTHLVHSQGAQASSTQGHTGS